MLNGNDLCIESMPGEDALNSKPPQPRVLLFYDGYERYALPGFLGSLRSEALRAARYTYRTMRGRQVRTGFYTAFLALVQSLRGIGCEVRINDFEAAIQHPSHPIGLTGYKSVLNKVRLPNPVIFGPGDCGMPDELLAHSAANRIQILIEPSLWYTEFYRPYFNAEMLTWFAGIDLSDWTLQHGARKSIDCLIYDKIRWDRDTRVPQLLDQVTDALDKRGLSYRCLRYAQHHQNRFRDELRQARSMIFLCEHETQGLAYQEALAAGVPVLAWDQGQLADPTQIPFVASAFTVSSVPYFDQRCGMKFKLGEFEPVFDQFWSRLADFDPRSYVRDELSLDRSARIYLDAYNSLSGH